MSKRQRDTEITALIAIVERLLTLDRDAQARIVKYLFRRFCEDRQGGTPT